MEFGTTGSGCICANVLRRLLGAAHRCVVDDINPDVMAAFVDERPAGRRGGA